MMRIEPGDADCARRFLESGDEAAFRSLVQRHAPAVLRTAHAVTGDLQAAEDATQETFLAVSRRLHRFDATRSFRAWVLGIALKCAAKQARGRRRAARREREVAVTPPSKPPQPADEAQRQEEAALLRQELAALPPSRRALLHLHYGEGLSHRELAGALGVATGTAKSRLGRALEALRRRLGRRGLSLAAVDLPGRFAALPRPEPTQALLHACAAKATLATGAGLLTLPKVVAAALVFSGAAVLTIATVQHEEARDRRALREAPQAVEARRSGAPTRETAPDSAAAGSNRPARPVAADPARAAETAVAASAGQAPGEDASRAPASTGSATAPSGGAATTEVTVTAGSAAAGPVRADARVPGLRPRPAPGGPTKWAPLPRHRGTATIAGRVLDAADRPVGGAEVYRLPLDLDRGAGTVVSFEFLFRLAVTEADGSFRVEGTEHGSFLLVPNYQRQLNRPRGMETAHAVPVTVPEQGTLEKVDLRLPVTLADLAPLRGRVRDEAGEPVARARVFADYVERFTDEEGRFDAGLVRAGQVSLSVHKTGYEALDATCVAEPGVATTVELTLVLRERGDLRLAGTILDDAGLPVADATVYLNAGNATVRAVRSDAQGRYAFEQLPERLAETEVSMNVYAKGCFPKYLKPVPVPADPWEVRVERSIRLVVTVVSAGTGEPLQQIAGRLLLEVVREGVPERVARRTWSVYREDGVLRDLDCPAGRVYLELEAPGHALKELPLDLDPTERERAITVVLDPSGPQ